MKLITTIAILFCLGLTVRAQENPNQQILPALRRSSDAFRDKKYYRALTIADSAIEQCPHCYGGYLQRGYVLVEMDEFTMAYKAFDSVYKFCNGCASASLAMASAKSKNKKFGEAYEIIQDMLNKDSTSAKAAPTYNMRAQIKMRQQLWNDAYLDNLKSYQLSPNQKILKSITLHEIHTNQNEKAEAHLAQFNIAAAGTGAYEFYNDKGQVLCEMKRYEEALTEFQKSRNLKADNVQALIGSGLAKLYSNKPQDALVEMERAVMLYPNNQYALNNLGFIKIHLERYADALKDIENSLLLDAKMPEAYNNIGYIYYKIGGADNYKKALDNYDKAIALGDSIYKPFWKYRNEVSGDNKR